MNNAFTELNEAIADHGTLHYEVGEYAKNPDRSKTAGEVGATDTCRLTQWLSTDGAAHAALPEYAVVKEAHARFHEVAANVVAQADARNLPPDALSEKGELKVSLKQLCGALAKMLFKVA